MLAPPGTKVFSALRKEMTDDDRRNSGREGIVPVNEQVAASTTVAGRLAPGPAVRARGGGPG